MTRVTPAVRASYAPRHRDAWDCTDPIAGNDAARHADAKQGSDALLAAFERVYGVFKGKRT